VKRGNQNCAFEISLSPKITRGKKYKGADIKKRKSNKSSIFNPGNEVQPVLSIPNIVTLHAHPRSDPLRALASSQ